MVNSPQMPVVPSGSRCMEYRPWVLLLLLILLYRKCNLCGICGTTSSLPHFLHVGDAMCSFTDDRAFMITVRPVLGKFDYMNCDLILVITWGKFISNPEMICGSSTTASSILPKMWSWQRRSPMPRKYPTRSRRM